MDPVILARLRLLWIVFDSYLNRMGVDIGETNILVHAAPMIGRKYIFGLMGKITMEKQVIDIWFMPSNFVSHII